MGCDLVRVSAYLDNELSETERQTFETHVAECPECTEELQRLRRVLAMSTTYAPPMDLHARVMSRICRDDDSMRVELRGRYRRAALAALVAAALVLSVGYWWMGGAGPQPSAPMVVHAPQETLDGGEDEPKSAATRGLEIAQNPAAPEAFESTTALPFRLVGTVEGGTPQAILVSTETNKQAVAGIGAEVAPGVIVKEIRQGEVVFDNNGVPVTLTKSATLTSTGPDLNGAWRISVMENGQKTDEFVAIATVSGNTFTIKNADQPNSEPLVGTLTGRQFRFETVDDSESLVVEGEAAEDGKHLTATAITTRLTGRYAPVEHEVTGEKLDSKAILAAAERKQRLAQIRQELQDLYPPFKEYAQAHSQSMPPSPANLAPEYVDNAEVYESTSERRVTYHGGLSLIDESAHQEPSYTGSLEEVSALMLAHEQALRQVYGRDVPVAPILLEVAYPGESLVGRLTVDGGVRVVDEALGLGSTDEMRRAGQDAQRASDQNNLKQMGLVIKMYQNEHKYECTPPGWLTVYPEYLTDPSVLTSPWDEEGTLSYEYFFPARGQDELLALGASLSRDPEIAGKDPAEIQNPAYLAKLQSEIPLLANNRDIPGERAALRNVLFLDGHVECIRMDIWEERVAPFIGR